MAYSGGYAGGYSDGLIPPPTPDETAGRIWGVPHTTQTKKLRTRTRYRLTITSSGALKHTDPAPVLVRTDLRGDTTHHRTQPIHIRGTHVISAQHERHDRVVYRVEQDGEGALLDRDEWLIFL